MELLLLDGVSEVYWRVMMHLMAHMLLFGLNVNMQSVVVVMLLIRTVLMLVVEGHRAPRWTLVS